MAEPTLTRTVAVTVIINDGQPYAGEARIDTNIEWVRSEDATKPDPEWTFIDGKGHFHAFTKDGDLPTLRDEIVDVQCDGTCGGVCEGEGYTITKYLCRICGQQIEPSRVPDFKARMVGIPIEMPKSATVTVCSDRSVGGQGEEVTVRVIVDDIPELIGVGTITDMEGIFRGADDSEWETTIAMRSLEPRLTS